MNLKTFVLKQFKTRVMKECGSCGGQTVDLWVASTVDWGLNPATLSKGRRGTVTLCKNVLYLVLQN